MKILTAEATAAQGRVAFEEQILQRITAHATGTHPGQNHVLSVLDQFHETGQHGKHLCLVTELLGDSLAEIQVAVPNRRLPSALVKSISKELLLALDFLHRVCGVVHTGDYCSRRAPTVCIPLNNLLDIKQDNIQFDQSNSGSNSITEFKSSIKLIDFGTCTSFTLTHTLSLIQIFPSAILPQGDHKKLIQPDALRAPEVIVGCRWGPSADIWNLGCLVGPSTYKPSQANSNI